MSSIPSSQMSVSDHIYQLRDLTTLDLSSNQQRRSASDRIISELRNVPTLDLLPNQQRRSASDRINQLRNVPTPAPLPNQQFPSIFDRINQLRNVPTNVPTPDPLPNQQLTPPTHFPLTSAEVEQLTLAEVEQLTLAEEEQLTPAEVEQLFSLSKLNQLVPEEKVVVQNWLRRLSFTKDYIEGGGFRELLIKEILRVLQLANDDSKFRESFFTTIKDSVETCGDDFALSVLRVGIACRLREIGGDIRALKTFLIQTVWAVEMLAGSAQKKIKDLARPGLDTVEVYLAFPIMLQQELGLDILPKAMSWFRVSRVTPEDLHKAADHVKKQRANGDAVCTFLSRCTEWTDVLKAQYPVECAEIAKKDYEQLEDAGTDPELLKKLGVDREKRWKDLTQWVLDVQSI